MTSANTILASAAPQNYKPTGKEPKGTVRSVKQRTSWHYSTAQAPATTTVSRGSNGSLADQLNSSYPTKLYVEPSSPAATQATLWSSGNPTDAAIMDRLAAQPTALWLTGVSGDVQNRVNNYVTAAYQAGALPVLVAYNIPYRDCGGSSSGGAITMSAYDTWISQVASGINGRPAIVILEPDALAGIDCLTPPEQQARLQMLSSAVRQLQSSLVHVYIDAGNADWQPASVMAQRLQQVGISAASGFSINVSNFVSTASSLQYGDALSSAIGRPTHFIIDTSRNGNGPAADNAWCNPAGRALGALPTLHTGLPLVDAFLWVKVPGESDGVCGPAQNGSYPPSAGTWWPAYALMLAQNAGW